jgi:hypothetical protein
VPTHVDTHCGLLSCLSLHQGAGGCPLCRCAQGPRLGETDAPAPEDQSRWDHAGVTIGSGQTAAARVGGKPKDYDRAYAYLKKRTHWMCYRHYSSQRLPMGSGITEAACKTVFTQRLKRSGMSWTISGGQVILDLRVIWLSGVRFTSAHCRAYHRGV